MTTPSTQHRLEETRDAAHAHCLICGAARTGVPLVGFTAQRDGSVKAIVAPGAAYEGYSGIVHGGVIATLLDAAMTNCLFAQGRCGRTGELTVRFRHPVASGEPLELRAWLEDSLPPLFLLQAELWQAGQLRATGAGKFVEKLREPALPGRTVKRPGT